MLARMNFVNAPESLTILLLAASTCLGEAVRRRECGEDGSPEHRTKLDLSTVALAKAEASAKLEAFYAAIPQPSTPRRAET
jgi:hypothetical protein